MSKNNILMAGVKVEYIHVYMKGVAGSPEVYKDVVSWRVGYNGILVIRGKGWTDVLAADIWNRIFVSDDNELKEIKA